jgi:predicted membrane protein
MMKNYRTGLLFALPLSTFIGFDEYSDLKVLPNKKLAYGYIITGFVMGLIYPVTFPFIAMKSIIYVTNEKEDEKKNEKEDEKEDEKIDEKKMKKNGWF